MQRKVGKEKTFFRTWSSLRLKAGSESLIKRGAAILIVWKQNKGRGGEGIRITFHNITITFSLLVWYKVATLVAVSQMPRIVLLR